jgi:predicted Zn-ribbon and HTH transcriptional regulator
VFIAVLNECPYCRADELYKSRFRVRDLFCLLFLLRPVRCGRCGRRHHRFLLGRYPRPPVHRPLARVASRIA